MSNETRPSALTEKDLENIKSLMARRGGIISIQDPRVSQVQTWMLGLFGSGVIIAMGWLANSVDNLNRSFERITVTQEYMERRITALESRR